MISRYEMPKWAVQQYGRVGGLVEDICRHGIGHPNPEWLAENDPTGKRHLDIHGCDGCCSGMYLSICSSDKGGCGCMTKATDDGKCGKCGAKKE